MYYTIYVLHYILQLLVSIGNISKYALIFLKVQRIYKLEPEVELVPGFRVIVLRKAKMQLLHN